MFAEKWMRGLVMSVPTVEVALALAGYMDRTHPTMSQTLEVAVERGSCCDGAWVASWVAVVDAILIQC